jgi:YVTN family beta-propeller protein
MSFRRVSRLAAMALATLLCVSCGQVYRPVVIPLSTTPPTPASFHAVFAISANVPDNPGGALQIDVAGDSIIAETAVSGPAAPGSGHNPTHAAILPNNSRIFVATAGSVLSGGVDSVASFTPAFQSTIATGFGPVTTPSLPSQTSNIAAINESGNLVTVTLSAPLNNLAAGYAIVIAGVVIPGCNQPACNPLAYDGSFALFSISGTTIQYLNPVSQLPPLSGGTASVPPQPVFVASTQNNAVYVANYNSNSIFSINTSLNAVSNTALVGKHPVALAEAPNGQNLYVVNQGSNTVTDLSPTDLSTVATIPVGNTPAWIVSRVDGLRMYVVTQGDGQLYTIRTDTNTVVQGSPQSVGGPGANFVLYDKSRNRLYVTNPGAAAVYVFDATTDPPTPLGNATGAVSIPAPPIPAGTTPCVSVTCSYSSVTPVSVAALPDGSRFYVASYVTAAAGSPCPDPNVTAAGCVIPQVTVFDAGSLAVRTAVFPLLPATVPVTSGFALAPVAFCAPVVPYTPAAARFRMSAAAAVDSSHVYASMCDAGAIADIDTSDSNINNTGGNGTPPDTLVADLPAAFSAGPPQSNGEPPNQNPIFLLTGQ